ncbi:hypothetical protein GHT06_021625 [Daphnia sinensis]|uniref:Endonuclease/exonuclease/phosphatase domain-containing protein n=1 Tax=Daphnia sinensis TaxID=1820382 RepID=A0AAD5PNU8_9CRUS|nr:hypothetical protein GHT06_021625 [Daphnia sinensis]
MQTNPRTLQSLPLATLTLPAVYAHNEDQQTSLLSIKELMNRPVICSLPLSSTTNRIGGITVGEACKRVSNLTSTAAYRAGPSTHHEVARAPDISQLKAQPEAVQEEMKPDQKVEFRHYLSLFNPEIALLSETHWNSGFAPKFKHHHILKNDRPNRLRGGVVILIRKTLHFTPIHLRTRDTAEAIGASIICTNKKHIDFISTYVPKGDCETEDIEDLLNRTNDFVIGGDFNGHYSL